MSMHPDNSSRSWLAKLLFVAAPADTSVPGKSEQNDFVLTALLRRGEGRSRVTFLSHLEQTTCDELSRQRETFGLRSLRLLTDASSGGLLSFFLQMTRSHTYTTWLCRSLGRPVPEPYRIRYGVLYDAVLQVTFVTTPAPGQLEAVLGIIRGRELAAGDCRILESEHQYVIYDAHPIDDERSRVNICFLVNRPPGMSRRECQSYWRGQHADLALRNMKYLGLTRYLQIHTVESPREGLDDDYDGIVYAEKASLTRLMLDLLKFDSFRFNNTVVIDETNFTFDTPIMLLRSRRTW